MLLILIKAAILFLIVLFSVRLMGKRQLGEMQPFELVIMLVVAELACIPINDPYVPIYYGVVPVITLTFMHIIISLIARKSIIARRIVSGKAIIAIDKEGINYQNLKKMNINVTDLIEALRSGGNMDINDIEYAIFETNGKLCVVEKESDPTKPVPALLPLTLIIDGNYDIKNMEIAGIKQTAIEATLKRNHIKNIREVLYMDIRQDGLAYVSPKSLPYFVVTLSPKGEW